MKRVTNIFICFLLTTAFITFPTGNCNAQLGPTQIPKDLSKRDQIDIIKRKTEAVLEAAYLKAENNLSKVKIGISLDQFFHLMGGFDIYNKQHKLIDAVINGHLMDIKYKGEHGKRIDKFLFGYVKNSLVVPKFTVTFIDFKLAEIKRFKKDYLEDAGYVNLSDKEIKKVEINQDRYNMERFLKAKERIKNVTAGMNIIEFVDAMEGHYVLLKAGEDYFIIMDGYLNFKGDCSFGFEDAEGHKINVWPFGYMDTGVEIPKFFVTTINDEIKEIVFDTDKEEFGKLLKCKDKKTH